MPRTKKAEMVVTSEVLGKEIQEDFLPGMNDPGVIETKPALEVQTQSAPKERVQLARIDAQELLARVIDKGQIELAKEAFAFIQQVRAAEAQQVFNDAFRDFQSQCPTIVKNRDVAFKNVKFSYAPIEEVADKVFPILSQNDLTVSFSMRQTDKAVEANCILTHRLGAWKESGWLSSPIERVGDMSMKMAVSAAGTNCKRLALIAVTGICPQDPEPKQTPQEKYGDPEKREQQRAETQRPLADAKLRAKLVSVRNLDPAKFTKGEYMVKLELPDGGGEVLAQGTDRRLFINLEPLVGMLVEITTQDAKPYPIILAAEGVVE